MNKMKILVPGAGPIIIGQAAEFDYSGSQCCSSLREAGHEVVLVNSNPATIQNDPEMADRIYIEPLLPEVVKRILEIEKPEKNGNLKQTSFQANKVVRSSGLSELRLDQREG